jgi:hypothetical protein
MTPEVCLAKLTKRQAEVLRVMFDDEEELVYERGLGYVGTSRVAARTLFGLLRACAVNLEPGCKFGRFERYTINGTGRELLNQRKL